MSDLQTTAGDTNSDPKRFINRELSWLAFNKRVAELAASPDTPLLERFKFLAISANNLEEFFMVRVAGIKGQHAAKIRTVTPEGLTIGEQLKLIRKESQKLHDSQHQQLASLLDELPKAGIKLKSYQDLNAEQLTWVDDYFTRQLFPVLTPIAVDPAHPFPFVKNLATGLALKLSKTGINSKERALNGLLLIPENTQQYIHIDLEDGPLDGTSDIHSYIHLHDVIRAKLKALFPQFTTQVNGFFQIIRDSDIELEEEAEDLVRLFQSALKRRQRGQVVRLTMDQDMPEDLVTFLMEEFEVKAQDVFYAQDLLRLTHLFELASIDLSQHRFNPFHTRFPERIRDFDGDCFAAIEMKDFIVHHPFESFDVVVGFLRQAAKDPDVIVIKQTLYRTSEGSSIVRALIEAAEAGKSVTALVELKARFDEEANIRWARDLERAGVQVVYGFFDLKTHAKISLVARREGNGLRTYAHFGTGNYHPITARVYTDLSYFTCDPVLTSDANHLFNYMTSYAEPTQMQKMIAAPLNMRSTLIQRIRREAENVKAGLPGEIWAKMNSLVDPQIIDELYAASQSGVRIELIVRGICCLRPQVPGLSDTIWVKSIVGRFLEHARISVFSNGHVLPNKRAEVFISSADWMPRNLDRRVETMIPIVNKTVHKQIVARIMDANRRDTENSWIMQSDGTYRKYVEPDQEKKFDAHDYFMTNPSLSGRGSALTKKSKSKSKVKLHLAPDPGSKS